MNPPSPTLLPSGELAARDDQLLMTPVSQRRAPARRRVSLTLASRATGPLTRGAVALGLGWSADSPWFGAAVVMIALSAGVMLSGHEPQWRPLLPLMGTLYRLYAPLASFGLLLALRAATDVPALTVMALAASVAAGTLAWLASQSLASRALVGRPKGRAAATRPARSARRPRRGPPRGSRS